MLEAQISACIAQHQMLHGVQRLGVAVSGGSDSVALLQLLIPRCRAAGVTPVVLHFDHGLRGAASAADARFVARLSRRFKVEYLGGSGFRVQGSENTDKRSGLSLEMNAREARQTFFRTATEQEKLDAIAMGHTSDDVAETLLLRLARGSGATGLSGLRPCHTVAGVKYVRPLLGCAHEGLRDWLRQKRQTWREDATNLDERIPRNRLRHTVLPWLEKNWSPSIRAMLIQSASILRDEDALLEELARKERDTFNPQSDGRTVGLSDGVSATYNLLPATVPLALQRRMLRQWLLASGCAEAAGWEAVEGLLARAREKDTWQVSLPGGVMVRAEKSLLRFVQKAACEDARPPILEREGERPREPLELKVPGSVVVAGTRVTARQGKGILRKGGPVGVLPSSCSLDAQALTGKKLLVRTRRPGDRIQPLGLDGSKSLQDLLVDAKVPVERRDQLPLLVVEDEVVWVPGYRVAKNYAVKGPRAQAVFVKMQQIPHLTLAT